MENIKLYAIAYAKKKQKSGDNECYIYIPKSVIEGKIEEDKFISSTGIEYTLISNSRSNRIKNIYDCIITEEDMLKYYDDDIEKAKALYLEDEMTFFNVGYFNKEDSFIRYEKKKFEDLYSEIDEDYKVDDNIDEIKNNENEDDGYLFFVSTDYFKIRHMTTKDEINKYIDYMVERNKDRNSIRQNMNKDKDFIVKFPIDSILKLKTLDLLSVKATLKLTISNTCKALNTADITEEKTVEKTDQKPQTKTEEDLIKESGLDEKTYRTLKIYDKKFKVDELIKKLDENLVGLENFKDFIKNLSNKTFKVLIKEALGYKNEDKKTNISLVFEGNPGTGKTTVARKLAQIYYELGLIKENKFAELSSKDFIGKYIGHSAPLTNETINKNKGGIIFIDEAYALAQTNNQSGFSSQALSEIMIAMNEPGTAFIFAGYTKDMEDLIKSNSGFRSRIGTNILFKDYTTEELVEMLKRKLRTNNYQLEEDTIPKIKELINKAREDKNFGNGRFIDKLYERIDTSLSKDIVDNVCSKIDSLNLTKDQYEILRKKIVSGELQIDDCLLSAEELTQDLSVNVITSENLHENILNEIITKQKVKNKLGF